MKEKKQLFFINQKKHSQKQVYFLLENLSKHENLETFGGALFKYRYDGNHHFSFVPCIVDGERGYHYNLKLRGDDWGSIIGTINANGEIQLIVKPPILPLTEDVLALYKVQFREFSNFFLKNGYSGEGKLTEITTNLLIQADLTDREVHLLSELLD
ncbi:MAG: hypothetical protein JXR63_12680 [Spirochaetales bacterium]|nr:hypothetical protein [Spirochaetales bacterium]